MRKKRDQIQSVLPHSYKKRIPFISEKEITQQNEYLLYLAPEEQHMIPFKVNEKVKKKYYSSSIDKNGRRDNSNVHFEFSGGNIMTHLSRNRNSSSFIRRNAKNIMINKDRKKHRQNGFMIEGLKVLKVMKMIKKFIKILMQLINDLKVLEAFFKHYDK